MRKAIDLIIVTVTSLMLAVILLAWFTPRAHAASEPGLNGPANNTAKCVTVPEFFLLQNGSLRGHVNEVLDGPGLKPTSVRARKDGLIQRDYKVCGYAWNKGRVSILYKRASGAHGNVQHAVYTDMEWLTAGTFERHAAVQ